ncbi:MAG: hypothetical protein JSW05_11505 [Candidatus Thorarchaeota archaeon]|nr:MAG: hypothetical protein JSW05_11505 [Candidatus Thorarchaeota archaeon]
MEDQLELMVKYLVHLQFYSEEEDVIFSRDKKVRIHVPGAKLVVHAFEEFLKQSIGLIREGQYLEYLERVAETLPIRTTEVEWEFQNNVRELGEEGLTDELAANFLIGPIRSTIQAREFEVLMERVKREARRRLPEPLEDTTIEKRLAELYSVNDPTVSLLYNLALLRLLTSIFGGTDLVNRVEHLVQQHSDELICKLL